MAKTTEKLVLSFDPETESFKAAAHNLSPDMAIGHAEKLQGDGITTQIIEQPKHHRAQDFQKCKPCMRAATEATTKHNQSSGQLPREGQSAAVPEEESEEELRQAQ